MGDPAGVGPEIIIKALSIKEIYDECRPIVIGDERILLRQKMDPTLRIAPINVVGEGNFSFGRIDLINIGNLDIDRLKIGKINIEAGRASIEYVKEAARLALSGEIDAIVTAPISKEAINRAGLRYSGHTDLLAELTGIREYAMCFVSPSIKVALITIHIPLREVAKKIKTENVIRVIRLLHNHLITFFAIERPRIGVAALNPHGGEGGRFGKEERMIKEAILEARSLGIDVHGPYPADTLFRMKNLPLYDAFIAMYHDQGLIPVKMIDFERAVNVTLGLPFPRTSVSHGTAFDIAGKNLANPSSMVEAIRLATKMAKRICH